jgi:hypothetical protein
MCLIHIFCLFDLFVFTKAISYDSPYIVYWLYSVYKIHCCWRTSSSHHHHKKICRNFVVMQRTLSNCLFLLNNF